MKAIPNLSLSLAMRDAQLGLQLLCWTTLSLSLVSDVVGHRVVLVHARVGEGEGKKEMVYLGV